MSNAPKSASRKRYEQILNLDLPTFLEDEFSHDPDSPFKNLRKMQKSALRIANNTPRTSVAAPSQVGKSTMNLGFFVPVLFLPGGYALYVTNSAANAEEMFRRFVIQILGDPRQTRDLLKRGITKHQKQGLRYPELTEIGIKTGKEEITMAATGATFRFVVASEDALAGKSPDRLILDEPPMYNKNLQKKIYDEAEARLGNSRGQMLETSTVRSYGETIHLPNGNLLYQGDVFYARNQMFRKLQQQGNPNYAALDFTYHASENLTISVPIAIQSTQGKKNHYWGIPLASDEQPHFHEFDPTHHVIPDIDPNRIEHHISDKWALGCDPGNTTAFTLLQIKVFPKPKLIVHYSWQTESKHDPATNRQRPEKFDEVCYRVQKEMTDYLGNTVWQLRYHADVASNQTNSNSLNTQAQTMQVIFGQYPFTQKQSRAEGTKLLKEYLKHPDSFAVCRRATHLINALKNAMSEKDRDTDETLEVYIKDGKNDHILDSFRYPTFNETCGIVPDRQSYSSPLTVVGRAY